MTDDGRAQRYARLQLWLAAASLGLTVGFLLATLATGAARALADRVAQATPVPALQVAMVAGVLGAVYAVLAFPVAWTQGYWLPRRYGLLHQSLAGWLGDRAKAAAI